MITYEELQSAARTPVTNKSESHETPPARRADRQSSTVKPRPGDHLCDTWAAIALILTEVKATDALLKEPLTETLSHFLAGQYAIALGAMAEQTGGAPVDLETLAALCGDVMALRRGDQNAQWLRLERHRVGIEYKRLRLTMQDTHEKWKTRLQMFLDGMWADVKHYPEAKAAWCAFEEQLRKVKHEPKPHVPPDAENPTKSDL